MKIINEQITANAVISGTEMQVTLKEPFPCLVYENQLKTSDGMQKMATSSIVLRERFGQTVIYSNLLLTRLAKALKNEALTFKE